MYPFSRDCPHGLFAARKFCSPFGKIQQHADTQGFPSLPVILLPFVAPAIRYNPRHVQPAPLLKNKGQQQERRAGLHPLWDGIKHTPKGRRFGVGERVLSRYRPSGEKKGHGIVPCPSSPPEALRCPFFRQSYSRVLNERAGRVCPTPSRRPNTDGLRHRRKGHRQDQGDGGSHPHRRSDGRIQSMNL